MADGVFRQSTIRWQGRSDTGCVRRVRQRVIALGEYAPRYCMRPLAGSEVMPWDDAPEITEIEED